MEHLTSIDVMNMRHWKGLTLAEAGLVRQSIVGTHVTADAKSLIFQIGNALCVDGVRTIANIGSFIVRGPSILGRNGKSIRHLRRYPLPTSSVTFGLFPELEHLRIFQAALDAICFPHVERTFNQVEVELFTDGSCLYPRWEDIHVSSGAVILAKENDLPEMLWSGLVPGQQGTFRGELLAAAVAAAWFSKAHIFSDCWALVRKANRLLSRHNLGLLVSLPKSHRDLWSKFWTAVTAPGCDIRVSWTPAHRSVLKLEGTERWRTVHNDFADQHAKKVCSGFVAACSPYRCLVELFHIRESHANKILRYHAQVAYRCVQLRSQGEVRVGTDPNICELDGGDAWELPEVDFGNTFLPEYFVKVDRFFREVNWAPSSGGGTLTDTSLLELYLLCTHAIGILPPVVFGGRWRFVDEGPARWPKTFPYLA